VSDILRPEERACLAAMAGRIFPGTDTPGALEAGAVEYIEQALARAYSDSLTVYRAGLGELDAHCQEAHGQTFSSLHSTAQDVILRELEAGATFVTNSQEFFEMVRQHTLEGVFGDPQYGGNRDMVGWRIVGFPGQQHGYPDPYINKVVDMPPRMEAPGRVGEIVHGRR
jgi:gluconate 2-dehydrogenase gamma chain